MTRSGFVEWPFAEVIDFQEGPGILAKDFRTEGVPLVRLSGLDAGASVLDGCDYLDPAMVAKKWAHFGLREGDILLSTSASLGRVAVVGPEGMGAIPYTGLMRMRPRDERVVAPFIRYLLAGQEFQQQIEAAGVGSVIRHFGPMHLKRMYVRLPPPDIQREIACILGALDDKIELNRRMNETLEAMARAIFKSWFVDFDPVRAKACGEPPESICRRLGLTPDLLALFPDSFQDSELGTIPAGWSVAPLSKIADVIMGQSPAGDTYNDVGDGMPLINGPVEFGDFHPVKRKWTTNPLRVSTSGDLIVCVRGSTTGRHVRSDGNYCLGRGVAAIRARRSIQPYVDEVFENSLEKMLTHATGSTFPSWSGPTLKQWPVLLAPEALLLAFVTIASPISHCRDAQAHQAATVTDVRDALLPRLLQGDTYPALAEIRSA